MFLFGGIWILVLWVKKAVECFEHRLLDHINRSMKDNGAENDLNCGNQEVPWRKMVICGLETGLVIFW